MPLGEGKYDVLCSLVRGLAKAEGAILMVLGGRLGSGFSAQLPPEAAARLPGLLREMANEIEKSYEETNTSSGSSS